jgi:type II secretory pathway component GspD/PulD (secretin)
VTQPSVTTLNDQVAQLAIQTQQSYLASQTGTISGQSSLSQQSLDPGVVTYGLQMYILPKIQNDKVFLQISSTLSDLQSISTVSQNGVVDATNPSATSSAIQVPILNEKTFNQRSVLRNGQTLVLAGFKSLKDNNQKNTVAGLTPLGGLAAESNTEELVVLITPTILTGDNF